MYTYGMYQLNDTSREEILTRLQQKISRPVAPLPEIEGLRPDLASSQRVYFAAENSLRIAQCMAAVRTFAHHGHQVVLAVPELIKDAAAEAWDYLPPMEKSLVRILLLPAAAPKKTPLPSE